MKSDPIFGIALPIFPIQSAPSSLYGAITNHEGRFLLTPMLSHSLNWPTENCFGG